MNPLSAQKKRLEQEIQDAKWRVQAIQESGLPDISVMRQLDELMERNLQLIEMIDKHLHGYQRSRSHY